MPFSDSILKIYRFSHQHILAQAERATDEELYFHPTPNSHNMAFTLWHLARWSDHLQFQVPGMTPALKAKLGQGTEIWIKEGFASQWGFPAEQLGLDQTGTLMDDAVAASIQLPNREVLLDYARQSFAAAEAALEKVDPGQYDEKNALGNPGETVLDSLLRELLHEGRHLGEMEYLLGLQGEKGTATR